MKIIKLFILILFISVNCYGEARIDDGNIVIDSSGYIGIGTSVPSNKLDIEYAAGVSVETFRGTTDADITGWILYNADGEACYVYPGADQTSIVVSATIP